VSNLFGLILNKKRYINKYLEEVNNNLKIGEKHSFLVETNYIRKNKILKSFPIILNRIVYFLDVITNRIFPKLITTKKIYFFITGGKYRVISKAETFGRLISCGFEILDHSIRNNLLSVECKKVREPFFDDSPTYGLFISLDRVGKHGIPFKVYKIRTMHPFSEYLQDYMYTNNNLKKGGKIKDDFRISEGGKFLRKYWIDELPMLLNILKGDIKLVGVRPLSSHYFNLYSDELQNERKKHKPGFIPPFYVDLPETLDEIMESELRYFKKYNKSPLKTDILYLLKGLYNVFFKGIRSS